MRSSGRAIRMRNAKSPTASIAERNAMKRSADEPGRRRRLRERGDHELRSGPRGRADGERERAAHGMAVGGDHAPEHEVPARRQVLHAFDERLRGARLTRRRSGRHLVAVDVGHRDDREARLDRLGEGQRDLARRAVRDHARRRGRLEQRGVRAGDRGQHEAESHECPDDQTGAHAAGHATGRRPTKMPPIATSSAATASTRATIVRVSVELPPRSDTPCTTGAGVSEPSGPDQSTTVPSE